MANDPDPSNFGGSPMASDKLADFCISMDRLTNQFFWQLFFNKLTRLQKLNYSLTVAKTE